LTAATAAFGSAASAAWGLKVGERDRPSGFERERALRRAMDVFWTKGYDGASLAELTAARSENITNMCERLGCAIEAGELPRGVDCQAIATFYVTVHQGMSIRARDGTSQRILLGVAHSAMAAWDELTRDAQPAPADTRVRKYVLRWQYKRPAVLARQHAERHLEPSSKMRHV
jgi:hypothetical protein